MTVILIKAAQLILALVLLVFLHELGHFAAAKLCGVRVSKFYIFFDWKFALWRKKIGDTEYGIGWLPFGGYCTIEGMVDETQLSADRLAAPPKPWEFRSKPAAQRLLIMAAGVLVNVLAAIVIYTLVLYHWGDTYIATADMTCGMAFNSEAHALGFRDGDILLATDRRAFKTYDADLYRDLATAHECRVRRQNDTITIAMPGNLDLLAMLRAEPRFVEPLIPAIVDSVLPHSAASKAGLRPGDRLLAVGSTPLASWNALADTLRHRRTLLDEGSDTLAATTLTLVVRHADTTPTRDSVDRQASGNEVATTTLRLSPDSLLLGITIASPLATYRPTHRAYGLPAALPAGIAYAANILRGYVSDLRYLASADGMKSLGGFATIGSLFPDAWQWHTFWLMTAFLSIILAFMNILPIPALDGGHIFFLLVELITRRRPSDRLLIAAEYVGLAIILLLMVVANLNDLLRLLGIY